MEYDFSGFENAESAKQLRAGLTGKLIGIGNSMTPYLKSRQAVICIPVTEETVLSKVNGHFYLHFIHAIKNNSQFLIGNAHGHMNGWVNKSNIFGKVVEKL